MKKYLFLLAWVEGSDSASGDATGVFDQKDLLPEYIKGNEYVFAVRIVAPNIDLAANFGYTEAFHENYTGYDTVSNIFEIDGKSVPDKEVTPLGKVADCREY
jgi:hypothetical protein